MFEKKWANAIAGILAMVLAATCASMIAAPSQAHAIDPTKRIIIFETPVKENVKTLYREVDAVKAEPMFFQSDVGIGTPSFNWGSCKNEATARAKIVEKLRAAIRSGKSAADYSSLNIKIYCDYAKASDDTTVLNRIKASLKDWYVKVHCSALEESAEDAANGRTSDDLFLVKYTTKASAIATAGNCQKLPSGGYRQEYVISTGEIVYRDPSGNEITASKAMSYLNAYYKAVNSIAASVPSTYTAEQKVKAVHDWLIRNVVYDKAAEKNAGAVSTDANFDREPFSPYGAVISHKAVCSGFAYANQAILKRLGVQVTYVTNNAKNSKTNSVLGHAWNRVKVDGKWYNEDVTWDNTDTGSEDWDAKPSSFYFLKSDKWWTSTAGKPQVYHLKWEPAGVAGTSTKYDSKTDWPAYWTHTLDASTTKLSYASSQTYNFGNAVTPAVKVVWNGKTLTKNKDYNVTYSNNTNVGTGKITVAGQGNYTGSLSSTFTIASRPITDLALPQIPNQEFNAYQPVIPQAALAYPASSKRIDAPQQNVDYTVSCSNNTQVGTASVVFTGKGNYSGTMKGTFKIVQADISKWYKNASSLEAQQYTGSAIEPALPNVGLKAGSDYTVSYKDNIKTGTAYAIVKGVGNCKGTSTLSFQIATKTMPSIPEFERVYTSRPIEPLGSITWHGEVLKAGVAYDVVYRDNVNVGVAGGTITWKGNYSGSQEFKFTIAPRNIKAPSIPEYTYSGKEITPGASSYVWNGVTLKAGTDYTVTYQNNINAGTATAVFTGMGNFTGTATRTFTIKPKTLNVPETTTPAGKKGYTGKPLTPNLHFTCNGVKLVKGTDYDLSYKDNIEVGTATIIATFKGNYAGTAIRYFTIYPTASA